MKKQTIAENMNTNNSTRVGSISINPKQEKAKIKVTVRSIELANEIIECWKDKNVNLEINIKENTTTENSDVELKWEF